MAAKNNKPTELTDIPLTLEQCDNVDLRATESDKVKSNSLKRFIRAARSGITSSKSMGSADIASSSEVKPTRSLQLRFGSFRKAEGMEQPNHVVEPSSKAKSSSTTESRLSLQGRLSSYWGSVFKKPSKKSSTNDVDPRDTPLTDINQVEQNQSNNL